MTSRDADRPSRATRSTNAQHFVGILQSFPALPLINEQASNIA
jgi:hypothetical protein